MSKISINGTEYGLEDALGRASLGDLYTLKIKLGVSVKTITQTFAKFGSAIEGEEVDPLDLLDDPDVLLNLQGIIWLSRRKAGETTSLEAAGEVTFVDIGFIMDDDEDEAAADPKALTDSVPAESGGETPNPI